MSLVQWINFPALEDERGSLVAIESTQSVPFEIKRVYYIFNTKPGVSRGFHAHKALRQIAICLSGKCRMVLDNGTEKESVWMSSPNKGLVIEEMLWHEMHDISPKCVLLMLASEHYDEADYIHGYDDFIQQVKE